jgi:ribosomal protein L24E
MANQKTCYYCGNTFPYTGNFGVKTSKFSQVYPVCSKKCEIEYNKEKISKNQKEIVQQTTFKQSEIQYEELQPSIKSARNITVSDIESIINEILVYCQSKGYQQKSFYLNEDGQIDPITGSRYTQELTQVMQDTFYFSREVIKNKSFKFSSDEYFETLWNIILYELSENYSPNMSNDQVMLLSENIFSSWKKRSSFGCFGSLAMFVIVFTVILTSIL